MSEFYSFVCRLGVIALPYRGKKLEALTYFVEIGLLLASKRIQFIEELVNLFLFIANILKFLFKPK